MNAIPFVLIKPLEKELIQSFEQHLKEFTTIVGILVQEADETFEKLSNIVMVKCCIGCGTGLDALMPAESSKQLCGDGDHNSFNTYIATALAVYIC